MRPARSPTEPGAPILVDRSRAKLPSAKQVLERRPTVAKAGVG